MLSPSRVAFVLALCVGFTAPCATAGPTKEYWELSATASKAAGAGEWDVAYASYQKIQLLVPEAPQPCYDAARCAARLGRTDDAFRWLERAAAAEYVWPEAARESEDFARLHDDERWPKLLDRMKSTSDEGVKQWRTRRPEPDPSSAQEFKSFRKLEKSFDRRFEALDDSRWRTPPLTWTRLQLQSMDERIAADRRYLRDHPQARDRESAAWDVVATLQDVRHPEYAVWHPGGPASGQIVEAVDAFLRDYPASSHRGDALTTRAFSVFAGRTDEGTKNRPWNDDDMQTLRAALAGIARDHSGTTAGGMALARNLALANLECVGPVTAEMQAMRAELRSSYASNRRVQEFLALDGRPILLRMDGIAQFDGVDLMGRKWNAASFSGKVTLIDFWATWCGPCVAEIPTLRRAWAEFRDEDFQIVGVSLDFDDRKTFETWLRTNDVTWPQIWDGGGFSAPLAKKFGIRSIPTPVLVDSNGRVDNASLRGEELIARIRELLPKR